ncbi:MAG TPA: tagatose 1,6-diphosphate aldolase [Anaerolineales bacterium]|nr:tagatose 1,6-diphosphate aldolase [Anaerolineales bacterium]
MNQLSLGKFRALQTASTERGVFAILAVDHRDALRVLLNRARPESVAAGQLTEIKLSIVKQIGPLATAILLDPVYSLGQAIAEGVLPPGTAFLSAIEEQGYLGDPYSRKTALLEGWGIEKGKKVGASGVKVLLFYHPQAGEATERQEKFVTGLLEECRCFDIPMFLEPIIYSPDPHVSKDSEAFAAQRPQIMVETVRRLGALQPDILKLEFPIDCKYEKDEAVWQDACAELNETSPVPWTLLSGGESLELFRDQLMVACRNGCSGFLVGRALWQEAVYLQGDERDKFLQGEALRRWQVLQTIADTHAHPWYERYGVADVDEHWYKDYQAE